jgi:hypothetical protein
MSTFRELVPEAEAHRPSRRLGWEAWDGALARAASTGRRAFFPIVGHLSINSSERQDCLPAIYLHHALSERQSRGPVEKGNKRRSFLSCVLRAPLRKLSRDQ